MGKTGPKPKPIEKKAVRLNVTIPPELYAQLLAAQGENELFSHLVARLLELGLRAQATSKDIVTRPNH